MFSQGLDKVDDSQKLSAMTGAYANLGARKEGAYVFFGVLAPFANEVFLVGSFDGWGEGVRLERGALGIWRTRISADKISNGDRYKFKALVGDDTVYLSDPYAMDNDGEPYFNSIYRAEQSEAAPRADSLEHPLNVYEIDADKWLCYDGRDMIDYATLSHELLPYLLQMGYTHVYLSGDCNQAQGGVDSLKEFIKAMHVASVGVLVQDGFGFESELDIDGKVIKENDAECSLRLVHKIEFEGSDEAIEVCNSAAYQKYFRQASDESVLRRNSAAMAYLLFKGGRMLTRMGYEAGREASNCVFDRHVFEPAPNARFQLFCSNLAEVYLSNPEIWQGSAIGERENYLIKETRRYANDFEMILVSDLSGNGGDAYVYADGEWKVRIDSSCLLGYEKAIVSYEKGKAIRISLPEYGAVILERVK